MEAELRLKKYLAKKGLKQNAVAQKLGESPSYMNKVLNGKSNFSHEFLLKIVRAFPDLDLNWLFRGGNFHDETHIYISEPGQIYKSPTDLVEDIEHKVRLLKELLAQE